uniref:Uncharacterized protein n=1 Tax=Candidatus Methanophagaceae archaeon ANME-1 ERB6 TaxID=2759912 RepID=A0A7G9Z1F9_9EURY|nr:hypothetical protein GHMFPJCE_00020 [Methanosarcinales archaeon ANME-1 ERB6]
MEWEAIFSLIVGLIVGGLAKYVWDRLTLAHEYKLKTINDRIDEFVKDSKKYFSPLALASGDLSQTLRGDETLQEKERAFYRLSKYLYQRERLRENTYFYFPSKDMEGDIINVFTALNTTISKMFGDNQKDIARIISYYESNKEYNDFCVLSAPSNEFAIFKSKIDESKFKKDLEENSGKLCSVIMDAITMTYESWYKQHKSFYSGLTNKLNRGKKQ